MNIHDTILLATRNQGKVKELVKMLAPFHLGVVGLDRFPEIEEVEETGSSFAENAMIKASHAAKKSGLIAVADDSGLMVDYLDGAPGIYSARFSAEPGQEATDERNNKKLLAMLEGVPSAQRTARFCSAVAVVAPDGDSLKTLGIWDGVITTTPKGENGFGYDPLFLDTELGQTAAEMSPHEKNERSHRARAMMALADIWPDFWARHLG